MTTQFSRRAALATLPFLGLALTGCESTLNLAGGDPAHTAATPALKLTPSERQPLPPAVDARAVPQDARATLPDSEPKSDQRLQKGDKVRIVVYGEDKISGDYELDQSGAITLPLAGLVNAGGLTKDELEKAVARKLREGRILRNPVVTVSLASFRPFYVLGEVERPGGYPYHNGLNVMSAVALAGGYTYRASKSKIMIQRAGDKAFTQFPLSPEVQIYPGDLIQVPERYF